MSSIPEAQDVNTCFPDGQGTLTFRLSAGVDGLSDPVINIDLASGRDYVTGTAMITGMSGGTYTLGAVTGTTSLSLPITGNFDMGDYVEISIEKVATCAATGSLVDVVSVAGSGISANSTNHSVLAVSLSTSGFASTSIAIGGAGTLSGNIVGGGAGCVEELEVVLTDATNFSTTSFTVGGVAVTPTSTTGTTMTYMITDFSGVGDGDDCFEAGEMLPFMRNVSITDCGDFSGVGIEASWGCDGSVCQTTGFMQHIVDVAGGGSAAVAYVANSYTNIQSSNYCTNWIQEVAITNTGAGPAFNTEILFGYGVNAFDLVSASIGTSGPIPFTAVGPNFQIDLTSIAADPDGTGGLSDLDATPDGQFDDLAIGDTIILRTEWSIVCMNDACPINYGFTRLRYQAFYTDICGVAADGGMVNVNEADANVRNRPIGAGFSVDGPGTVSQGDTEAVSVSVTRNNGMNGPNSVFQCPDDSLVLTITTPPGARIDWGVNSGTLANNAAGGGMVMVDIDSINDTTYTIAGFVSTQGTRVFTFDVEFGVGCDPSDQDFVFDAVYICDASCACVQNYACDFVWEPDIRCDITCTEGVEVVDASSERLTLGYTDETASMKVNRDDVSEEWLQTATLCDTVCWSFVGIQQGSADSVGLHIEYTQAGGQIFDIVDGGEVTVLNAAGTTVFSSCALGAPITDTYVGDVHSLDWDFTNCLTAALSSGDSIFVNVKAVVRRDAPLPDGAPTNVSGLSAALFNTMDGNQVVCGTALSIPQRLHSYGFRASLGATAADGCNGVQATISTALLGGDRTVIYYPEEYRQVYRVDSIRFRIDELALSYDPTVTPRIVYFQNSGSGVTQEITVPPVIGDTFVVFVNDGTWPLPDLRFARILWDIRVGFLPSCESTDGRLRGEIFYTEGMHSNDPACQIDSSSPEASARVVDFSFAELGMTNLTGVAQAAGDVVSWDVRISETAGVSAGYLWAAFEGIDVMVDSVLDVDADTFLNVESFLRGEWVPIVDSFASSASINLRVFGSVDSCTNQTLSVYTGWACDAFPDTPSRTCYADSLELMFGVPATTVGMSIVASTSQDVFEFCDVINDTVVVSSTGAGSIYDVVLHLFPGTSFVEDDNMVEVEYPIGSGNIETLPVTVSNDTLIVHLSEHSGIDTNGISGSLAAISPEELEAQVIVNWVVSCTFRHGDTYNGAIFANDLCGDLADGNGTIVTSSAIPGVQPLSEYTVDLSMSQDTVFNCDTNMINVLANMFLGNSTPMDTIFITLPLTTSYVDGTYECMDPTPAASCPEFVEVRENGDTSILVLRVPENVIAPTEIMMNFDIEVGPATICLDSSQLRVEIIQFSADVPCDALGAGTVCEGLDFVLVDVARTLYFDPVEYEVIKDTALCFGEPVPLMVVPSPEDSCIVINGAWNIVQGDGMLDTTKGFETIYMPAESDLGKTVIVEFVVPETDTALLMGCRPLSESAQICYARPYVNCNQDVNFSCGQLVTIGDLLAGGADPKFAHLYSFELKDQYGAIIPNPIPSDFEGQFWATVSYQCNTNTCETTGQIDNKRTCSVTNNLDTAVWCIDEFLTVDPDSDYYRDTLNLRPYAVEHCTDDTFDVTYEGEWIETFECGDTLKQLIRGWRATTKAGNSCVNYDTITVIRLPDISQHMYAPQKDTVNCVLSTYIWHNFKRTYYSWKQIVGVHSDTTFIRYPYDHSRHVDLTEIWTAWDTLTDEVLKDSLASEYKKEAVILRWDSIALAYDTFSVLELYENTSGLFRQIIIDGELYVEYAVQRGDQVMTNGGEYNVVDDNWFYEKYAHGFWVDLTYPYIYDDAEVTVCDAWEYKCNGVEVILPNTPYDADTCRVFCLNELAANTKCLEVVDTEEKDLGGNCPRVTKRHTLIKQSCFASGADLSTISSLVNCPQDTNTGGVVVDSFGTALNIEVEQWIMYIDTIAPLVDPKQDSFEIVFSTEGHSCMGEVVLPQIEVKDVCSGVKEVKATIGVGNTWVVYNDEDGDGVWTAEAGRTIRIACGESYPVQYEIMDSCHNLTAISRNWVSVEDREAPLVIMEDTLTVSIGGKEVWMDGDIFDKGSSDNCDIARVLVRRTDWLTACGVDVCPSTLQMGSATGFEEISSEAELDAFIRSYGITAGLGDNAFEQYYAEQYDWLVNDGEWCPLTSKERAAGLLSFKDQLIAGWENDIKAIWAASCIGVDEHGNSIIDVSSEFNLGGGWGDKIPVCCEDVCEEIVVEMLVIDKNCNYTKGWTIVNVEDNSMVEEACEFEELRISCNSYAANYADLVEAAQAGEEGAYEALDEALGGLVKGWRSADNKLVDYAGEELPKTIEYVTSSCKLEIVERKVLDTAHDGEIIWVTTQEPQMVIVYDTVEADLGGVYQLCGSECIPSVWVELNECGVGKITRRWEVYGGCAGSPQFEAHRGDGLVFDQVIYVTPSCELNKYSLSVPNDSSICSPLIYGLDGNVDVDGGRVEYLLEDASCRQLGINYVDEVFDIVGRDELYKIHRTWTVSDWCNDAEVECVQKIILNASCDQANLTEEAIRELELARSSAVKASVFELFQNAPNPFTESTVIRFNLPEASTAELTIFDVSGRVLYSVEADYEAGTNELLIGKQNLEAYAGHKVLLYQLQTEKYTATKQMTILE